jgi:hypothetical protein
MVTTYYGAGTADVYQALGFIAADVTEAGLTDSYVLSSLQKAQREIQERTKTHFVNYTSGTQTPGFTIIQNEKHDGQGKFNRAYYTKRYPIPDVSTYISGTVAPSASTISVDSTNGFPSSGIIFTGTNKVTYTGKTAGGFTGCSGVTIQVTPDTQVLPYGVEISVDDQGNTPTWQVMTLDDEYDVDLNTGRFYLYKNYVINSIYTTDNPPNNTPNRVRMSYYYGWSEIPYDITRCTILLAIKELMHMIVRRATMKGLNSFNPSMLNVDDQWIDDTILRYSNPMFDNVN